MNQGDGAAAVAITELRRLEDPIRFEEKIMVRTALQLLTLQRGGAVVWEINWALKLGPPRTRELLAELEEKGEAEQRGRRNRGFLWASA